MTPLIVAIVGSIAVSGDISGDAPGSLPITAEPDVEVGE
jgi:hypothetical protein